MRTPEGDLYTAAFGGYHPDINSPAADWYVDVIRELIPAYHGDAFFADGMTFAEYGQSEYTVKRFREEMKRDYPRSLAEDPDWRGTVRWEVAQVDRFWNKLKSAIKERDPKVQVAVLSSEPTMYYRGRSDAGSHANDLVGALRMLDALHVQHDVVADWNLTAEFLKPYRLVILPNTGCMSDAQVAAVREYVTQGGTVLATAETSLFDENGATRNDFALGDVFGVKFDETPSNAIRTTEDRRPVYLRPARTEHEVLRRLPETDLIIPGDSTYARPRQGQATAALIEDAETPVPSPATVTERTALQVNDFGKGKAIWVRGTIFAHSSFRSDVPSGVEWVNGFVSGAVEYLAPAAPWG